MAITSRLRFLLVGLVIICGSFCSAMQILRTFNDYLIFLTRRMDAAVQDGSTITSSQIVLPCQTMFLGLPDDYGHQFLPYLPLLPAVMLWRPELQFPLFFPEGMLCPVCGTRSSLKQWNCGQDCFSKPRFLHDEDRIILLVGVVYRCSNRHEFLSYDRRILDNSFPHKSYIPFLLSYKTGFTLNLIRCILACIHSGMDFSKVVKLIQMRRKTYLDQLIQSYYATTSHNTSQDSICEELLQFCNHTLRYQPSRYSITCIFVDDFFSGGSEKLYSQCMQGITSSGCICLDHTFKVAANIGYFRSDRKWITQFSSVFIVVNEIGQVLTWKFTKGESLAELKSMLTGLKTRLMMHRQLVNSVCIDNCCQWRAGLQDVFGANVTVYLDLFHAVQRISRTISKRNKHYYECMKDLSFLFRSQGDIGKKRSLPTPSPEILLVNLDKFLLRWQKDTLITAKTLKEIDNLKNHVRKGCLSGIPPCIGTNRNEALHRKINPFFRRTRISVPMAFALLPYLFFCHNLSCSNDTESENPAFSYSQSKIDHDHSYSIQESFGLHSSQNMNVPNADFWGITNVMSHDDTREILFENSDVEMPLPNHILTYDEIKEVLLTSLDNCQLANTFEKLFEKSPVLQKQYIPFLPSSLLMDPNTEQSKSLDSHATRLEFVLQECGLKRIPVIGDGNCCFRAATLSIRNLARNPAVSVDLNALPIDISKTNDQLHHDLREGIVKEWQGNSDVYKGFLLQDGNDIISEASKFLNDGFFNSELGDTMVTALANFLGTPIFLFTSIDSTPILHFHPRQPLVQVPLLLAYNQHGEGHYDSVGFCADTTGTPPTVNPEVARKTMPQIKCSCGKNDKVQHFRCYNVPSPYSSCCPCLKSNTKCSSSCSCKNCKNPNGKKPGKNEVQRER